MEPPRSKKEILAYIQIAHDLAATPQYALEQELFFVQELAARDQLVYLLKRIRGLVGIMDSDDEKLSNDRRVVSRCLTDIRQLADVALDNPLVRMSIPQQLKFYAGLFVIPAGASAL